jgi:hypothetical protein
MHRIPVVARRAGYAAGALPVALVRLALATAGRRDAARQFDARFLERCFGPGPAERTALRAALSIPAFALAAYLVLLLVLNLAYPLRPDVEEEPIDAWGGPTLAGAWAVHAVGGVVVVLLVGIPLLAVLGTTLAGIAGRTARDAAQE